VNVSSSAIHNFNIDAVVMPAYGLTKSAGALLVQQIAKDVSPDGYADCEFSSGWCFDRLGKCEWRKGGVVWLG
jgi:hypothetical protein